MILFQNWNVKRFVSIDSIDGVFDHSVDWELKFYSLHFQNDLKANITILEEKEESLKKSLETLEKFDEIDVDEAVTTTAPLYKQYDHKFVAFVFFVTRLSISLLFQAVECLCWRGCSWRFDLLYWWSFTQWCSGFGSISEACAPIIAPTIHVACNNAEVSTKSWFGRLVIHSPSLLYTTI